MLKFSPANIKLRKLEKKLGKTVSEFSLLSGHSCPFASKCLSMVISGKIRDGKNTEFRCYSASQEALYPNVFKTRRANLDEVKGKSEDELYDLISSCVPKSEVIRMHVAGDFFSLSYMKAWVRVAKDNKDKIFYGYTKAIPFWLKLRKNMPKNFILTASYGGKRDDLIGKYKLKYAKVVYSAYEAKKLGLPLDWDDSHALGKKSFALLIHGMQPKDSKASKALFRIRKTNKNKGLII